MAEGVSKNIAIFGVRGSGKTTYLTTIFYKFYHEQAGKEIEVDIEDERVVKFFREYLSRIRRAMKEGVSKPDEVLPPTLERKEISFKVREAGKNWFNFRVVDYRGEDVEELSPDILDVFKKSDQIVAVIDAYRYADENDYREMVNDIFIRLLKKAGKKGDFPLTILLTKYDLVESEYPDFGEYKEEFLKDLEETLENEGYTNVVFMPISCFRVKDGKLTLEDMNVENSLLTVLRRWRGEMVPVGGESEGEEGEEEGIREGVERRKSFKKLVYLAGGIGVIALLFFIFFTGGGENPPSPEIPKKVKKVEKKVSFSVRDYNDLCERLDRVLKRGGTIEEMETLIRKAERFIKVLPPEKGNEIERKIRRIRELKERVGEIKKKHDSLIKDYEEVKQGKNGLYDLDRLVKRMSDFLDMDVSDIPRKCVSGWIEEVRRAKDELERWGKCIKEAESIIKSFDRAFEAGNMSEMKKIYNRADELVTSLPSALKLYRTKLKEKVLARYDATVKELGEWRGKFAWLRRRYKEITKGEGGEEVSEDDLKGLLNGISELRNRLSGNTDLSIFLKSEVEELERMEKGIKKYILIISDIENRYNALIDEYKKARRNLAGIKPYELDKLAEEMSNFLKLDISKVPKGCAYVDEWMEEVRRAKDELERWGKCIKEAESIVKDFDRAFEAGDMSKMKKIYNRADELVASLPSALKLYRTKLKEKVLARYDATVKELGEWRGKFAWLRRRYKEITKGEGGEEVSEDDLKGLLNGISELRNRLSGNTDLSIFLKSEVEELDHIEKEVKECVLILSDIKERYNALMEWYEKVKGNLGKIEPYELEKLAEEMSKFLKLDISGIPKGCTYVGKWMNEVRAAKDELERWGKCIKEAESIIKSFDRAFEAGNMSEMKKIYNRADELVASLPSALKVYRMKLNRKVLARYDATVKALKNWRDEFARLKERYEGISSEEGEEVSEDDLRDLLNKMTELKGRLLGGSGLSVFLRSEVEELERMERGVKDSIPVVSKYNKLLSEWKILEEGKDVDKVEEFEKRLESFKKSLPELLLCYKKRIDEILKACNNIVDSVKYVREKYREIYDDYDRLWKGYAGRDKIDSLLEKARRLKEELRKRKDSLPSDLHSSVSNDLDQLISFLESVLEGRSCEIIVVEYEFDKNKVDKICKEILEGAPDIYFANYVSKRNDGSYEGTFYVKYSFYWRVGNEEELPFYDYDSTSADDYVGSVFIRSLEDMVKLAKGDQMDIICQGTKVGRARFTVSGFDRPPTLTHPDNI